MMTMAWVAVGRGFKCVLVLALLPLIFSACDSEGTQMGAPDRHSLGPADAAVTLVAFDDYQ